MTMMQKMMSNNATAGLIGLSADKKLHKRSEIK